MLKRVDQRPHQMHCASGSCSKSQSPARVTILAGQVWCCKACDVGRHMGTFVKCVADKDVAADRHIGFQGQIAGALVYDLVQLL